MSAESHSALSQTLSGLKGKCDSCPAISRLAIIVDNTKETVRDMQDSVSTTREDIAEIRGILSQLPAQIGDVKDSMRHEIKAAMRAAVLSAGGADPDKTPRSRSSNSSEVKLPGGVSWKAPTMAIATVAVIMGLLATVGYLGSQVVTSWAGRPVPTKTP